MLSGDFRNPVQKTVPARYPAPPIQFPWGTLVPSLQSHCEECRPDTLFPWPKGTLFITKIRHFCSQKILVHF